MAKRKRKSNLRDNSEVKTIISDFIDVTVDTNLDDLIEEKTQPFIEEERAGVAEAPKGNPRFKTLVSVKLKDTVQLITNHNLTESVKQNLINNYGYCEDDFIY